MSADLSAVPVAEPAYEPGLYRDVPDAEYHRDTGSLSSSGARTLLFEGGYQFRHEQLYGRPPKVEYDEGHAAHLYVLGKGAELDIIDADDWMTKRAKDFRKAAYDAGKVPLLRKQDDAARAMAKIVLEHDVAGQLFAEGEAEMSGWWLDEETGAPCRLRTDWLTMFGGRALIVDYKTSKGAGRDEFAKAVGNFGYYMQHPFYRDGLRALRYADDAACLFVTQCKTPPYRVTVAQVEPEDIALGAELNRIAIRRYAEHRAANHWPDEDAASIATVSIPNYVRYRVQELLT